MPKRFSSDRNCFLLRGPATASSANFPKTESGVGNGSISPRNTKGTFEQRPAAPALEARVNDRSLLLQTIFVDRHADMPRVRGRISKYHRADGELRDIEHGARAAEDADMPIVLQQDRSRVAIGALRLDQK